jgi:hypothetical protein
MAPIYLALTMAAVLYRRGWREWPRATPAVLVFALALVPAILWQFVYPDRITELLSGYRIPGTGDTLGKSLGGLLSTAGLRMRLDLFWSFFSPSFLFIAGDSSAINSTREIGFFPLLFAVLLPAGLWRIARGHGQPISLVIAGGFLTAPIAAVLSGELETNRVLYVLPFGALLATYGIEPLLTQGSRVRTLAAVAAVMAVVVQFGVFYADYVGGYRTRTSFWFGGNLPGALTTVIEKDPVAILLSREIPYVDAYWRFYAIANHRPDLIDRVGYVDGATLPEATSGTAIVCASTPQSCAAIRASADWRLTAAIDEPNGER